MKSKLHFKTFLFLIIMFSHLVASSQDTFSIVAVDSETGEVGSAGASCLDDPGCNGCGGVIIISDVKPGKGAIHTQAYYHSTNQSAASNRMDLGDSPEEIINWLNNSSNDIGGNPTIRQYGIVDFDEDMNPRSAAFTGTNTDDYKNHIVGDNYSIQGNILLGQEVLDSMETRFLNTEGSLAVKLMAALQGANVPGADTRCMSEGVSSLSAFIRVAKPDDEPDNLFLEINVKQTDFGVEPIDVLQDQFDNWFTLPLQHIENQPIATISPNPNNGEFSIIINNLQKGLKAKLHNIEGKLIQELPLKFKNTFVKISEHEVGNVFILTLENEKGVVVETQKVIVN